jgi:hypothetical protein
MKVPYTGIQGTVKSIRDTEFLWCAKGDLNPHAEAHAPQTCVSTNSTIRAGELFKGFEGLKTNCYRSSIFQSSSFENAKKSVEQLTISSWSRVLSLEG